MKKCPICGTEHNNNYDACHRCMGLARLMGGRMSVEDLVAKIWRQCPKCYAEFICDAKLQGDDFVILCDGCGETIRVPFSGDDIFRYIQAGMWGELEE